MEGGVVTSTRHCSRDTVCLIIFMFHRPKMTSPCTSSPLPTVYGRYLYRAISCCCSGLVVSSGSFLPKARLNRVSSRPSRRPEQPTWVGDRNWGLLA